jgi:hypothetical protein
MVTTRKKNISTNSFIDFFNSPVKKVFAILTGFLFVAGLGYTVAIIQKNIEFKLDKIELAQECNERIQEKANACKAAEQENVNKKVEDIESVVKDLKKKMDEEKK